MKRERTLVLAVVGVLAVGGTDMAAWMISGGGYGAVGVHTSHNNCCCRRCGRSRSHSGGERHQSYCTELGKPSSAEIGWSASTTVRMWSSRSTPSSSAPL